MKEKYLFIALLFSLFLIQACSEEDISCEEKIVYPENTIKGLNILHPSTLNIEAYETYSFALEKNKDCRNIKIVITKENCNEQYCWAFNSITSNWLVKTIDPLGNFQIFNTTAEKNELEIVFNEGIFNIVFYETDDEIISRTKTLVAN